MIDGPPAAPGAHRTDSCGSTKEKLPRLTAPIRKSSNRTRDPRSNSFAFMRYGRLKSSNGRVDYSQIGSHCCTRYVYDVTASQTLCSLLLGEYALSTGLSRRRRRRSAPARVTLLGDEGAGQLLLDLTAGRQSRARGERLHR